MTRRIIVPIEDERGLDSHIAEHFGRAPYFAIIDTEKGKVVNIKTQPNTSEHFGGAGHPHERLLALKPDIVIARGMGPGGLQSFRNAKATVLKAVGDHVSDVVEALKDGKLSELTGGCEHAHHHEHEHIH